jgi:hypothetical protein
VSNQKRRREDRTCAGCATSFSARADQPTRYCSKSCAGRARRASPETRAKMAAKAAARWTDPAYKARLSASISASWQEKMATDPEFRRACSERSSAMMTRLHHEDPAFQARRSVRSREVMTRLWADPEIRARFEAQAAAKYAAGIGVSSEIGKRNKAAANKWILKRANAELRADTEYNALFRDTQARLRLERPYDGPQTPSDYNAYLADLCREVVNSPEMRALQDAFMAKAIPRCAAEWNRLKEAKDRTSFDDGRVRQVTA